MSPTALPDAAARARLTSRTLQNRAEQVRLLDGNVNLGAVVTVVAAALLGALEWTVIPHQVVISWCVYMCAVSLGRHILSRRYRQNRPSPAETGRWAAVFAIGAGMAGTGWAVAGVVLYPETDLTRQVYLVFVIGGMMLGAASLLAPRRGAFAAFLIPTGLAPAARLLLQGDQDHLAMGLLAGVFTVATLVTTNRIHLTILSSLMLRFENQELVQDLQRAKSEAD